MRVSKLSLYNILTALLISSVAAKSHLRDTAAGSPQGGNKKLHHHAAAAAATMTTNTQSRRIPEEGGFYENFEGDPEEDTTDDDDDDSSSGKGKGGSSYGKKGGYGGYGKGKGGDGYGGKKGGYGGYGKGGDDDDDDDDDDGKGSSSYGGKKGGYGGYGKGKGGDGYGGKKGGYGGYGKGGDDDDDDDDGKGSSSYVGKKGGYGGYGKGKGGDGYGGKKGGYGGYGKGGDDDGDDDDDDDGKGSSSYGGKKGGYGGYGKGKGGDGYGGKKGGYGGYGKGGDDDDDDDDGKGASYAGKKGGYGGYGKGKGGDGYGGKKGGYGGYGKGGDDDDDGSSSYGGKKGGGYGGKKGGYGGYGKGSGDDDDDDDSKGSSGKKNGHGKESSHHDDDDDDDGVEYSAKEATLYATVSCGEMPEDVVSMEVSYVYELHINSLAGIVNAIEAMEQKAMESATSALITCDRRRLSTGAVGLSAWPADTVQGSCGENCYVVAGTMTVFAAEDDAETASGELECGVVSSVRDSFGDVEEVEGIESITFVEDEDLDCDFSSAGIQSQSTGKEGLPVGAIVALSISAAALLIMIVIFAVKRRTNSANEDGKPARFITTSNVPKDSDSVETPETGAVDSQMSPGRSMESPSVATGFSTESQSVAGCPDSPQTPVGMYSYITNFNPSELDATNKAANNQTCRTAPCIPEAVDEEDNSVDTPFAQVPAANAVGSMLEEKEEEEQQQVEEAEGSPGTAPETKELILASSEDKGDNVDMNTLKEEAEYHVEADDNAAATLLAAGDEHSVATAEVSNRKNNEQN